VASSINKEGDMASEMAAHLRLQSGVPVSPSAEIVVPAGMSQEEFRAMGTTVNLLLPEAQKTEGAMAVKDLFAEWEQTLSRFQPESELSQLNRHAGEVVIVSKQLFKVMMEALKAAQATDGIYDPALLNQLVQLGYDRSFDELPSVRPEATYHGQVGGAWRSILVDSRIRCIVLPVGVQVDFGGIAKGMAVDAALERLQEMGIDNALVNAGGDLAVRGLPPEADHWSIAIPGKDLSWALPLHHGAIATSGVGKRHWLQGNEQRHHLLDPHTGLPARSGLWSVTVVAESCVQAEISAKVAFILGREEGKRFLERHQLAGLFVEANGKWEAGDHWPEHLMRRLP
jgi:FAD:protein FMN transferase